METGEIGFRIRTGHLLPDPALVEAFRGIPAANLADAMGRFGFMDPGIRARTGLPLCGPAVTILSRPGDNLMVHKAMEIAPAGSVLAVNTGGNTTSAVFGELMGRSAVSFRLGGIVVDGAIRDVAAMTALSLPAFSREVSIGGCDKDGPGEINVPIACGNAVVMPGDILVGDADGVAVIPRDEAGKILERVRRLREREKSRIREIESGQAARPDVDEALRRRGVIP